MTHYLINISDSDNLVKEMEHEFKGETPPKFQTTDLKWVELFHDVLPEYDIKVKKHVQKITITINDVIVGYDIVNLTSAELNVDILDKRKHEYGEVGDQLDTIYHDRINNTNLWQDHIAKVKSDNPKIKIN